MVVCRQIRPRATCKKIPSMTSTIMIIAMMMVIVMAQILTVNGVAKNSVMKQNEISRKLHKHYLLLSTVNSIRFWSPDCPIHRSCSLYVNSSRRLTHMTPGGISGMAVYSSREKSRFLFWYDEPVRQLYYASIEHDDHWRKEPCTAGQLRLGQIFPLSLTNLTNNGNYSFITLVISSTHDRLFMFHVLENRIDSYQIFGTKRSSILEIRWLQSYHTPHPTSPVIYDSSYQLVWIESWKRFCQVDYRESIWEKKCTANSVNGIQQKPQAMASHNGTLFWIAKPNLIMMVDGNHFQNPTLFHELPESTVAATRMVWDESNLFIHDQRDVLMVNISNPEMETITVLIESQQILEMIIVSFDDEIEPWIKIPGLFARQGWLLNHNSGFLMAAIFFVALLVLLALVYIILKFKNNDQPAAMLPWSNHEDDCAKLCPPPSEIVAKGKRKYHQPGRKQPNDNSDIEDLISNPFIFCQSCPEPDHCAQMQMCTFKSPDLKL